MPKVTFLTGIQGTGKTTFCRYFSEDKVVYIGKLCREKFGPLAMSHQRNPITPELTESFVRDLVFQKMSTLLENDHIYIDGFPRSEEQVKLLSKNSNFIPFGVSVEVMFFHAPEEIRLQNLANSVGDAVHLVAARMNLEKEQIFNVLNTCVLNNVPVRFVCVDFEKPYNQTVQIPLDTLRVAKSELKDIFDKMKDFNNTVFSRMRPPLSTKFLFDETYGKEEIAQNSISVQWARKFVEKTVVELSELLKEIPDEWWVLDSVSLRKARVELIDAVHFLISASLALGMDCEDFYSVFLQKLEVNYQRQKAGYVKKSKAKNDDEHVGKISKD